MARPIKVITAGAEIRAELHHFASIGELVRDIKTYLSDRNAAAKPYTWKAEGAGILEKINR
jgi:hypothetical protein